MASYIVTYDLLKSGQNYDDLIRAIKSYGTFCHLQQSVWIVVSTTSAETIRNHLQRHIDSNDKLFVGKLNGEAAWVGYPQNFTDWLHKNL